MSWLPLSTYVVSGVHGQMVCQSAGSDTAGDLAQLSMSMSNVPLTILHAGCMSCRDVVHAPLTLFSVTVQSPDLTFFSTDWLEVAGWAVGLV